MRKILENLATELKELVSTNAITAGHIESIDYNRMHEAHSIILGALARAVVLNLDKGSFMAHGQGLKASISEKVFIPDITLWSKSGKRLIGVIDYESTNSTDFRIFVRNFENYKRYSIAQNPPEFWLAITTAPSKEVEKWVRYKKYSDRADYERLKANPFAYYAPKFIQEFRRLSPLPLFAANLDSERIKVYIPENSEEEFLIFRK